MGNSRCLDKRSHGGLGVFVKHVGIGFGIKFHSVGAHFGGGADVVGIGVHKNRGADAGLAQDVDNLSEERRIGGHVPSGRRGEVAGLVGHQGHLLGLYFEHKINEFGRGVALDVEFRGDQSSEFDHIVVTDVALVGARMHRDALGTEFLAVHCHLLHVGIVLAAGIPQGRYLVDVYTEICKHCKL